MLLNYLKFKDYFTLGPIVILNFLQPLDYSDPDTYRTLKSLQEDMKTVRGMNKFDMNWLDDMIESIKQKNAFHMCPDQRKCFLDALLEKKSEPQYADDFNLNM